MSPHFRRRFLRGVAPALLGATAGCAALSARVDVRVALLNTAESAHRVHVEILDGGAVRWSQEALLPPAGSASDGGHVVTNYALRDVPSGRRFDLRGWVVTGDDPPVASRPLVVEADGEGGVQDVGVRVHGDAEEPYVSFGT